MPIRAYLHGQRIGFLAAAFGSLDIRFAGVGFARQHSLIFDCELFEGCKILRACGADLRCEDRLFF